MKRLLTALLFTCIIGISYHSNAAFIDNGTFTTDDVSELDWLDLSITDSRSINAAEGLNPGWTVATNDQVGDMFGRMFPDYPVTLASLYVTDSHVLFDNAVLFRDLFGFTYEYNRSVQSFGMYKHENGGIGSIGVEVTVPRGGLVPTSGRIFGPANVLSVSGGYDYAGANRGVFLVRDTVPVVPIPAAIWLFGTGLIALLGFARRKV